VTVEAVWHERGDQDAGLRWFVGEVQQATRAASGNPPRAAG